MTWFHKLLGRGYAKQPQGYWEKRGHGYSKELSGASKKLKTQIKSQEQKMVEKLADIKFNSILEVGCGTGRILKLLNKNFNCVIMGVDFSQSMLDSSRLNLNDESVKLVKAPAQDLPFENNSFDVVITSEVLMHIPKENIKEAVKEICRVSSKYVVITEFYKEDIKLAEHCFLHDYTKLFEENGCKLVSIDNIPKLEAQSIFFFKK